MFPVLLGLVVTVAPVRAGASSLVSSAAQPTVDGAAGGGEACAAPAGASALGACQAPAAAADSALDAQVRKLASELGCPVCQGLSVEESQAELSREFKALIREQLAAGRTPAEVKAYFVSKYGEWILLQPEAKGFNLLVYVLPVVALLAGAGLLVARVRRWTRVPAESGVVASVAEGVGAGGAGAVGEDE